MGWIWHRWKEHWLTGGKSETIPPLGWGTATSSWSWQATVCLVGWMASVRLEKALFWFLGDTVDCRAKCFHLELGRWIWNPEKLTHYLKIVEWAPWLGEGSGDGRPDWDSDLCYPTKLQLASSASRQECALSPLLLIACLCDLTLGRRRVWVLAHLTLELRKTAYPFNNLASLSAKGWWKNPFISGWCY